MEKDLLGAEKEVNRQVLHKYLKSALSIAMYFGFMFLSLYAFQTT
jgi:hypothetical protein